MVDIARFTYPAEAQTLMALLRSEGIECTLKNEIVSQVYVGYVDVQILESDVPRAMEVMRMGGYEIPEVDEQAEQIRTVSGWIRKLPLIGRYPFEKQLLFLFLTVALLLTLLIVVGSGILTF